MINLTKLSRGRFLVTCPDYGVYEVGSLSQAMESLDYCGVRKEEIDRALSDMELTGNNQAEFGVNKDFLYSYSVQIHSGAAAEEKEEVA